MQKKHTILFAIFLFFLGFIIFYGFWDNPIYIWDEAIYANNALEMSHANNYLLLTLNHEPNLYNTKPPLAIWILALSIKLFGANEFAIRFPSVLAFIFLLVVLIRFSKNFLKNSFIGFVASIVLLGSPGIILLHSARSGDLDSLLVFVSTLFILSCIKLFLIERNEKLIKKEIILCGAFLLIGYFIKSTSIFLLLPGVFICFVLSKSKRVIIKQKVFYIIPVLVAAIICIYYLIMHFMFPAYNKQMFFSEYSRLVSNIMPWHRQPFLWYFHNLITWKFTPYIFALVPAAILGLKAIDPLQKQVVKFLMIILTSYLIIISSIPDKLEWYDLPVYPLMALVIGIGLNELVRRSAVLNPSLSSVLMFLAVFLFAIPIFFLHEKIKKTDIADELEKPSYCIKKIQTEGLNVKKIKVLMKVEEPLHKLSIEFYRKALKGRLDIKIIDFVSTVYPNDTILYTQNFFTDSLHRLFGRVDTIYKFKYGVLAVIK